MAVGMFSGCGAGRVVYSYICLVQGSSMPETLYLIDAYAQIFRAYYAIRGGMRSPITSEPTHAVYGFTAMLFKLLNTLDPHYAVVAIDTPGPTFRDEIYAGYERLRSGYSAPDIAVEGEPG